MEGARSAPKDREAQIHLPIIRAYKRYDRPSEFDEARR